MKKYDYIAKIRHDSYNKKIELLKGILEEGKSEGVIAKNIDVAQWAGTINALRDGMISLNLLDKDIDLNKKSEITFQNILHEIMA